MVWCAVEPGTMLRCTVMCSHQFIFISHCESQLHPTSSFTSFIPLKVQAQDVVLWLGRICIEWKMWQSGYHEQCALSACGRNKWSWEESFRSLPVEILAACICSQTLYKKKTQLLASSLLQRCTSVVEQLHEGKLCEGLNATHERPTVLGLGPNIDSQPPPHNTFHDKRRLQTMGFLCQQDNPGSHRNRKTSVTIGDVLGCFLREILMQNVSKGSTGQITEPSDNFGLHSQASNTRTRPVRSETYGINQETRSRPLHSTKDIVFRSPTWVFRLLISMFVVYHAQIESVLVGAAYGFCCHVWSIGGAMHAAMYSSTKYRTYYLLYPSICISPQEVCVFIDCLPRVLSPKASNTPHGHLGTRSREIPCTHTSCSYPPVVQFC